MTRGNAVLFAGLLLAGFALGLGLRACGSGDAPAPAPERKAPAGVAPVVPAGDLLVDLGNATCPVMGGEVDGEHYVEWKGLRVGFCCAGCDRSFLKEPEKALATTQSDWRAALDAVAAWRDAAPGAKAEALQAIRARWTVLREPGEE